MQTSKKTLLTILAAGTTVAFAGTMGPECRAVNVTLPCDNTAWDVGGRALYMQATGGFSGNTYYGNSGNSNSVLSTEAKPRWGWGFQLEGSYHYSTGNDFNVNWYHYRSGGATHTLGQSSYFYNTVYPSVRNNYQFFTGTSFSNHPAWDQVNMEFGQHVDFGENKFVRLHAGLNFSRVAFNAQNIWLYGQNNSLNDLYSQLLKFSTVYNGFGPRAGLDLNYEWSNGWQIYGMSALSLLAGTTKGSCGFENYGYDSGLLTGGNTVGSSHTRVVGELDAKLGLMYTYAVSQGDLSIDLGWAFTQYLAALNTTNYALDFYYGAGGGDIAPNQVQSGRCSNFGIQGLYLGLKWTGNLA